MMKKNSQSGFTLIEMIVVVAVMAMVAGAMIYNFRQGDRQKRLNLARDSVLVALRTAQNYALAGKQIPPENFAPWVRGNARCANNNSPESYWVEFAVSNTYNLMAEDHCGAVMRIQQFTLTPLTRFSTEVLPYSMTNSIGSSETATLAVRFSPPFAVMTATTTEAPLSSDFENFLNSQVLVEMTDGSRSADINIDGISGKME